MESIGVSEIGNRKSGIEEVTSHPFCGLPDESGSYTSNVLLVFRYDA
jgi:hypothetical protein